MGKGDRAGSGTSVSVQVREAACVCVCECEILVFCHDSRRYSFMLLGLIACLPAERIVAHYLVLSFDCIWLILIIIAVAHCHWASHVSYQIRLKIVYRIWRRLISALNLISYKLIMLIKITNLK